MPIIFFLRRESVAQPGFYSGGGWTEQLIIIQNFDFRENWEFQEILDWFNLWIF